MTRDAVLPMIAALHAGVQNGLAARVALEPDRFTAADRLQEVPPERMRSFVAGVSGDAETRAAFLAKLDGTQAAFDQTDGPRMTLTDGRIVHLRPAGNAPELRLYVEADAQDRANETLRRGLAVMADALRA